ncbi:MAG: serine/threonine protein kinase [Candidatus Latescibacterota bacterium]|nr:MAG: serine/threonine protein kinase [Candidatus Latescibacterota bacterium]
MRWLSDRTVERLRAAGSEIDLTHTRYRLIEPIGRGGMGTVYLVEDPALDRRVALKVLDLPDAGGELTARLIQEARVLARLEHPGIVPVHDVGELEDGRVFYTMKFVRGDRLDRWVRSGVSLRQRLVVFRRLCEAVAFAHAQRVLHRDLKPQNIMVGAFGEVLVMDWGVAKILRNLDEEPTLRMTPEASPESLSARSPGASPQTRHGTVLGTPGYMPPEQARGESAQLDERADVYALGAVLAFLLGGRAAAEMGARSASKPRWGRGVPRALRAVAEMAMRAEPAERYRGADELAAEVDRFLEGRPVMAHPESILLRAGRFLWKHRIAVILLLVYAIVRALVLLAERP